MFVRGSQVTLGWRRGGHGEGHVRQLALLRPSHDDEAGAGTILEVWHNQLDCHCNAKLANARSAMTLGGMPEREGGGVMISNRTTKL